MRFASSSENLVLEGAVRILSSSDCAVGVETVQSILLLGKPDAQVHHFRAQRFAFALLLRALGLGRFEQHSVLFLLFLDVLFQLVYVHEVAIQSLDDRDDFFEFLRVGGNLLFQRDHYIGALSCLVFVERCLDAHFGYARGNAREFLLRFRYLHCPFFALRVQAGDVRPYAFEIVPRLLYLLLLRKQTGILRASRAARDFAPSRVNFAVQ